MSESSNPVGTEAAPTARPVRREEAPEASPGSPIRRALLVPGLIAAVGLFVGGLYVGHSHRPKADPARPLEEAVGLVEAQKYEEAIEALNKRALAFIETGEPTPEQRQAFHIARARAFSGAQATLGISRPENNRTIVGDYKEAERLGARLEPSDASKLAESLIALDQVDEAVKLARALPADQGARRTGIMRSAADRLLDRPSAGKEQDEVALSLLAELAAQADLSEEDRAWVLTRQGEMLIAAGRSDDAIAKLLREMQRLKDVPAERQGELLLLLGRAYHAAGQEEAATKQLESADAVLGRSSPLRAEADVLMARIMQSGARDDEMEQVRERYTAVLNDFAATSARLPALLGLAEANARMGDDAAAIERYAELIEALGQMPARRDVSRRTVSDSLLDRSAERGEVKTDLSSLRDSLRYAELAESLYAKKEVPEKIVLVLAEAHRAIADRMIGEASQNGGPDFTVEDADPATRAEIKEHLLKAGDEYRVHAGLVSTVDNIRYAESLWDAADCLDRAGDQDEARKVFLQYADGASGDDPRKPEARYRLAQIFQASREYASAATLYRELKDGKNASGSFASGPWSERSVVPLARCLLADADPSNDAEGENLLLSVADGSVVAPKATEFRDAVIELAGLYYATGRYAEAISRLEEAVARYPESRQIGMLKYKLADSNRLSAEQLRLRLEQAMPAEQRKELEEARRERLRKAMEEYEGVKTMMETKASARLTPLESIYLRNSYFGIGDCAYDLKEYDASIAAYDAARAKYPDDPSSLVAMVQIVNAYVAQGKWAQARTANERARLHLARFPDEVWARPDLPMERKHWERWLDSRALLEQSAAAGADTNGKQ